MIGMNILSGKRLRSIGMLWIRHLIFRPLGPALVPLGAFVLEPHFDAFGQRLLWASSFAGAQGLTTHSKTTSHWSNAQVLGYFAGFCQPCLHIMLHLIRDAA